MKTKKTSLERFELKLKFSQMMKGAMDAAAYTMLEVIRVIHQDYFELKEWTHGEVKAMAQDKEKNALISYEDGTTYKYSGFFDSYPFITISEVSRKENDDNGKEENGK